MEIFIVEMNSYDGSVFKFCNKKKGKEDKWNKKCGMMLISIKSGERFVHFLFIHIYTYIHTCICVCF